MLLFGTKKNEYEMKASDNPILHEERITNWLNITKTWNGTEHDNPDNHKEKIIIMISIHNYSRKARI